MNILSNNTHPDSSMPKFSEKSTKELSTCHEDLQTLFKMVIKYYDCTVLEGHRSEERQAELYRTNKSKVVAGKSKHNKTPSLAVDVVPWPIDWQDTKRFYHFVGYVLATADQLGIRLRCGADWDSDHDLADQTFFDLPHFEIKDQN